MTSGLAAFRSLGFGDCLEKGLSNEIGHGKASDPFAGEGPS